jgi:hypothetical protein
MDVSRSQKCKFAFISVIVSSFSDTRSCLLRGSQISICIASISINCEIHHVRVDISALRTSPANTFALEQLPHTVACTVSWDVYPWAGVWIQTLEAWVRILGRGLVIEPQFFKSVKW